MTHHPDNRHHGDHMLKGILLLIGGVLLLLYALNILTTGITFVFIIISVALIVFGAMLSGLDQVIKNFIQRLRNKSK
jgi:hypothetical protein